MGDNGPVSFARPTARRGGNSPGVSMPAQDRFHETAD